MLCYESFEPPRWDGLWFHCAVNSRFGINTVLTPFDRPGPVGTLTILRAGRTYCAYATTVAFGPGGVLGSSLFTSNTRYIGPRCFFLTTNGNLVFH